jgi:hypothetical protein
VRFGGSADLTLAVQSSSLPTPTPSSTVHSASTIPTLAQEPLESTHSRRAESAFLPSRILSAALSESTIRIYGDQTPFSTGPPENAQSYPSAVSPSLNTHFVTDGAPSTKNLSSGQMPLTNDPNDAQEESSGNPELLAVSVILIVLMIVLFGLLIFKENRRKDLESQKLRAQEKKKKEANQNIQ